MKVVVGLGNPGNRYAGTRHNVGFMVIDVLGLRASGRAQLKFDAELLEAMEGDEKVLLAKPQTFMNLSGRSVRQILDFYQVTPNDLLVVCDDVNLPLGQLRIRPQGSHGGHNGLRDIQNHLGSQDYARLRVGVGGAEGRDLADYVLDRFQSSERVAVEDMTIRAAQAVGTWLREGTAATMNQFNVRETKGST